MDTAERLLALLGLLQHRAHWSADDLADRLRVTARTVRRDVARLRSYGYPVEAFAGHGGGYRLGSGANLPPLLLDDDEVLAVVVGLGAVGASAITGLDDAVVSALGKIEQVMPSRLRSRLDAVGTAVVDATGASVALGATVDRRTLTSLARAVSAQLITEFAYVDRLGRHTSRRVEPVQLVRMSRSWYLAAFDLVRDDWRTFRLDRISAIEVFPHHFVPRAGPDPVQLVSRSASPSAFAHRALVAVDAAAPEVRRRVPPAIGTIVAPGETVETDEAGETGQRTLVEIGTDDLDWLVSYLIGLPWEVEVVEPAAARRLLARRARRLARMNGRRVVGGG